MYVYIQTETNPDLFTTGFYRPDGTWEPDSDHPTREEAEHQVAILNGGTITKKHLPDLIKAYVREDGSEGTATYRDIVTDLLHHATDTIGITHLKAFEYIMSSAKEVFLQEYLE